MDRGYARYLNHELTLKRTLEKEKDSMNKEQVKAYVDTQVQNLADLRIKPLIQTINGELESIRRNELAKDELDKKTAEANERIAKLQESLGKAKTEVADLADRLSEATQVAAS